MYDEKHLVGLREEIKDTFDNIHKEVQHESRLYPRRDAAIAALGKHISNKEATNELQWCVDHEKRLLWQLTPHLRQLHEFFIDVFEWMRPYISDKRLRNDSLELIAITERLLVNVDPILRRLRLEEQFLLGWGVEDLLVRRGRFDRFVVQWREELRLHEVLVKRAGRLKGLHDRFRSLLDAAYKCEKGKGKESCFDELFLARRREVDVLLGLQYPLTLFLTASAVATTMWSFVQGIHAVEDEELAELNDLYKALKKNK